MPIDPRMVALADAGRIEEIDDPIVDTLATALDRILLARPKAKENISLI
jgi:hypothetical protein